MNARFVRPWLACGLSQRTGLVREPLPLVRPDVGAFSLSDLQPNDKGLRETTQYLGPEVTSRSVGGLLGE